MNEQDRTFLDLKIGERAGEKVYEIATSMNDVSAEELGLIVGRAMYMLRILSVEVGEHLRAVRADLEVEFVDAMEAASVAAGTILKSKMELKQMLEVKPGRIVIP